VYTDTSSVMHAFRPAHPHWL